VSFLFSVLGLCQACMGAKYISLLYVLVDFNILPALLHPVLSRPGQECYMPPKNGIRVSTIQNICIYHSSESINLKAISLLYHYYRGSVSMLLTTVLLMYIYTACWLNNYVVQLCPFWCNSYGARLARLLTGSREKNIKITTLPRIKPSD